ncbi:MAG: arginine--tRNA ligase [Flavobacteriales bacterium]|nr:arginine--tRNA ligase [Flavobacteriales bacterium]
MIEQELHKFIELALQLLYQADNTNLQFQKTRKEFEGDVTLVVFPLTRVSKKSPEQTAEDIGKYLKDNKTPVTDYNVVKGFLNLCIDDSYWLQQFQIAFDSENFGCVEHSDDSLIHLVEFSSPNTNKPLHLGHIRNILLGASISKILQAAGKKVKQVQIINDRGIHICKSMVAWLEYGNGETPHSTQIKGDHFVGKYYVIFDKHYRVEQAELVESGMSKEDAEKQAPLFKKAQELLRQWEAKDSEVIALWQKMNNWVYSGFASTYDRIGVNFDKNYYESDTYLLGKAVIQEGLDKGTFFKRDDGSVWIDLTADGLDEKILLRSDGTAVYMTQDIGTAIQRHQDFDFSHMVYTVGNEQDYHFKVLFLILDKLGYDWAKNCYHLSYGMVDLPSGKMKSREGTVVDADDLMQDMVASAKAIAQHLGKLDGMDDSESELLYENIGMGALKYFMLKVDPKKRMLFDPKESIDFNGNTGPFIQYTHARIQTMVKKYNKEPEYDLDGLELTDKERVLIKQINNFPTIIQEAANSFNPALIANYVYDLVKEFNGFYQNVPILIGEDKNQVAYRIALCQMVARVIKTGMKLLGVNVPDRM